MIGGRRWGCKDAVRIRPPRRLASGWLFEPRVARLPKPLLAARRGAAPTDRTIASGTRRTDRSLNEVRARRGVPGPTGPHHGHRPSGRHRPGVDPRTLAAEPLDAADLLRQLVYLPNASLLVAESRRVLVGGALLVLRPSVTAGGYVGTIDLLVVGPGHDADRVTDVLLEELLRSARNKGCATVEMAQPSRSRGPRPPRSGPGSPPPGLCSGGPLAVAEPRPAAPSAQAARRRRACPSHRSQRWARTSPSSWTWRTSSTRPRRPAWTSTTSRC